MPKNFSEFIQMMDERPWFRMVVFFTPGLVVTKLSGYRTSDSWLSTGGTILLVTGISLYLFWARLRARPSLDEVEPDAEGADAPVDVVSLASPHDNLTGHEQMSILTELQALCGESGRGSDRLIAIELHLNPALSFSDASRTALARRKLQQQH